jgi:hypothetical protein
MLISARVVITILLLLVASFNDLVYWLSFCLSAMLVLLARMTVCKSTMTSSAITQYGTHPFLLDGMWPYIRQYFA